MIFVLVSLFFISSVSAAVTYDCHPNMVGYWKFDGDATDSYTTDPHNGDLPWPGTRDPAQVDQGAYFDGSQEINILSFPGIEFSQGSRFTIEFWFDYTAQVAPFNYTLIEKGTDFRVLYDAEIDKIWAEVAGKRLYGTGVLNSGPNHIVLRHTYSSWSAGDWSGSIIHNYLTINGVGAGIDFQGTILAPSNAPLKVGTGFTGWIDELAIYDDSLVDFQAHYASSLVGDPYCPGTAGAINTRSSTTESEFTISGCPIYDDNGVLIESIPADSCSGDGEHYCPVDSNDALDTYYEYSACSFESSVVDPADTCCASGYTCNGTTLVCDHVLNDCIIDATGTACTDVIGCVEVGNVCTSDVTDYSCDVYEDELTCLNDTFRLGRTGLGTEICGTEIVGDDGEIYSIPFDYCRCEWEDIGGPSGKQCVLAYDVAEWIANSTDRNAFTCLKNFTIAECIDGDQDVSWTARPGDINGSVFLSGIPIDVLQKAGCEPGDRSRGCGAPVIKLPGFSLFAFVLSVGILGLFYYRRESLVGG
jgi:hypothetical protein